MITSIELEGFKSFILSILELGRLTLFTGLNSSGKSSVIQAIQLLEKAYTYKTDKENLFLAGHGGIEEFLNPYAEDGLRIEAVFDEPDGYVSLSVKSKENTPTIQFQGHSLFPEIIYISADRFGPETSVPVHVSDKKLGKKGENIFNCIENYADDELPPLLRHEKSEGDTFLYNLRAWLSVISPNVKFNYQIQKMSDSSYSTFNGYRAKNVGFGLSYALPVITALLLGSITPNSLVIIENPEAHLHPKGQTEMARLIALCVEAGVQVIIETHSDHLFNGIRIYAKQSKNNFHQLTKLYWFELDSNNNTQTELVEIDNNGRITEWHKGLFDQFEINARKLL